MKEQRTIVVSQHFSEIILLPSTVLSVVGKVVVVSGTEAGEK